jgi:hypothetical protein
VPSVADQEDWDYITRYDGALPAQNWDTDPNQWNTIYLAGLYRMGLMLTQNEAYTLLGDDRYPGRIPTRAPRCREPEPDLWSRDTWVVYRD